MGIGDRIRQARKAAQMSMRLLAEKAGVSAMAISKYERDVMTPSSDVLLRLAQALGVRVEYFLRPVRVDMVAAAYRKHKKLGVKAQQAVEARIKGWLERYLQAESLFEMDRPRLDFEVSVSSMEDVEAAAESLRETWDLGSAPIENMIQSLEDHGISVGLVEGGQGFDACTFTANGVHIIAVDRYAPGDRQRYNLAHELGHLVLRISHIDEEKAAHRFAAAFLVPASEARRELGRRRSEIGLGELHLLKHRYGLSMQAWIYRARDLGIITKAKAAELFKQFRMRGWHRSEPGEEVAKESPTRLRRLVLRALAEDMISKSRAEELLGERLEPLTEGDF